MRALWLVGMALVCSCGSTTTEPEIPVTLATIVGEYQLESVNGALPTVVESNTAATIQVDSGELTVEANGYLQERIGRVRISATDGTRVRSRLDITASFAITGPNTWTYERIVGTARGTGTANGHRLTFPHGDTVYVYVKR